MKHTITTLCRLHVAGLAIVLATSAIATAEPSSLWLYGSFRSFKWEEPDFLVTEDGPLYGAGLDVEQPVGASGRLLLRGEVFGGEVDYDGTRQDFSPYKTKTAYIALHGAGWYGHPLAFAQDWRLVPLGGAGVHAWKRRLDDVGGSANTYDEDWLSLYASAGLQIEWLGQTVDRVYLRALYEYPLYTREIVQLEFEDRDQLDLEPGGRSSWRMETGIEYSDWRLSGFYEKRRYDESERDANLYYQPASEGTAWGFMLGTRF